MKSKEFCKLHNPCQEGRDFALTFDTMLEVWQNCQRPDWLFWILEKYQPLTKEQSVRLAIAFAETCIDKIPAKENRPLNAINAAKAWLENPCEETRSAAWAAESAAWAAESAAESAARSAAWAAESAAWAAAKQCDLIREYISNPFDR